MTDIARLQEENHQLLALCDVLDVLLAQLPLRTNPITCELLGRLHEKLSIHLCHEDRDAYQRLLAGDTEAKTVASQFISNTHELNRILERHGTRWCARTAPHDSETYAAETRDILRMLRRRIELEETRLFPVVARQPG